MRNYFEKKLNESFFIERLKSDKKKTNANSLKTFVVVGYKVWVKTYRNENNQPELVVLWTWVWFFFIKKVELSVFY